MTREKLVRDRIPEVLDRLGVTAGFRRVPAAERLPWLLAKLEEECAEVVAGPSQEEIADVLEVLHALAAQLEVRWEAVEDARRRKALERGAFSDGVVMRVDRSTRPGHESAL
ncbi:hypothetical protein GRS96_15635 [Rathayibacter sp. VKM Ac-2803]|uniref:nucleoside triphosphate pyrophosphohydrolase n=1 Tax=unclassified Rathayibacter TaxID=2609250 RepID=UPI00135B0737|nr:MULTISPECIES: nucleoside triphosphate pyrophosphohydrolase [unclassified Rathayibacter]MWV50704.1 hypothetical protein [Rathayibacter sp. VKM Ac-2803]MWV60753.1 hypothetical protein [Rathayibacter sp. VKM Ac-2754]